MAANRQGDWWQRRLRALEARNDRALQGAPAPKPDISRTLELAFIRRAEWHRHKLYDSRTMNRLGEMVDPRMMMRHANKPKPGKRIGRFVIT